MAKVIVTGGSGFIGSHIVDALVKKGCEVIVIDKQNPEYPNKNAFYTKIDIANLDDVTEGFEVFLPDYVIHCAAQARIQKGIDDPIGTFEANCRGTLNILLASYEVKVKRVIYSASCSAYGLSHTPQKENMPVFPLNPYALYKFFGEELCRIFSEIYGLKTVSLRYFNVYGPRMSLEDIYSAVIARFLDQWKRENAFTVVSDGHQSRDFIHVFDVVRANLLAISSKNVGMGEVINIGSGKSHTIIELADIIGGRDYPWILIEPRMGEVRATRADITKAKKLLNWKPKISLEQGIEMLKNEIK